MMVSQASNGPVLVIGSASMDFVGRPLAELSPGTSAPGLLRASPGGGARNVAENLARLGMEAVLLTAVGNDPEGRRLLTQTGEAGVVVDHVLTSPDHPTGCYLAVLDGQGGLHLALDDMRIVADLTPEHVREHRSLFQQASAVFVDANLAPKTLAAAISLARAEDVPIAADPTSVNLAPRLLPHVDDLWLLCCNEAEAEALCGQHPPETGVERAIDCARALVSMGVRIAIVAMAEFGVGYATTSESGHVPAVRTEILDPTGAGDALTAAAIFALLNDIPIDEAVRLGVSAAALTLRTRGAVVPDLSLELLYGQLR